MNIMDLAIGKVTVSELSDTNCRDLLRAIIKRHGNNLAQLEVQLQQDEARLVKVNVENESSTQPLRKI